MFISWIRYHGRSADLAAALGMDSVFLDGGSGSTPRRYLRQWSATRRLVREQKPADIIVMQPPLPALFAVLSTREGRRAQVIADLHTGALENPKWRWASGMLLRSLKRRGFAVVTNEALAERVAARGVRAVALHDLIPSIPGGLGVEPDDASLVPVLAERYIVVPLAYANDEPVTALLEAAAADPSITWVLTGKAPHAVRDAAAPNIQFTGYVTNDDFQRLLRSAAAIAALTDREYTMQRAGYEALGAERPLITASTKTLSQYFGDAAVYMDGSAASIAAAARAVLDGADELSARMATLRVEKIAEQRSGLESLRATLREARSASALASETSV